MSDKQKPLSEVFFLDPDWEARLIRTAKNVEIQAKILGVEMPEPEFNSGNLKVEEIQIPWGLFGSDKKAYVPQYTFKPMQTETATAIILGILPETLDLFLEKNKDYGDITSDGLGLKGLFPDIWRKTAKLKRYIWDDVEPNFEGTEEVLKDLIGHALLSLLHLRQEQNSADYIKDKAEKLEQTCDCEPEPELCMKTTKHPASGMYVYCDFLNGHAEKRHRSKAESATGTSYFYWDDSNSEPQLEEVDPDPCNKYKHDANHGTDHYCILPHDHPQRLCNDGKGKQWKSSLDKGKTSEDRN